MKHDCRYGGLVVSDCFKFPLRTKLKGRNRSLGGMLAKFQPHTSSFGRFEPGANSPAAAAYGESAPAPGNFVPLTFSRASAFRYFQSCTAVTISERQPSAEAMTKLLCL